MPQEKILKMFYPLLTHRLSIEPLSRRDLDNFIAYRQDPEVAKYQSWDISYSQRQALELLESQSNVLLPSNGSWLQLAIHDQLTGELFGDIALHSLNNEGTSFEIGFTLAQVNQGKGIAKEAISQVIKYLFDEVGALSIVANCDHRNSSAIKLLLSLGFEQDRTKSWTEHFKNELVTVDHFELVSNRTNY